MADFVDPLVTARIEAATVQLEAQADRAELLLDELESGTVASVNGQSGVVTLDADDISDTTTVNKFITQAELDKLAGVESGAQVNTFDFADAPSDGSQYARQNGAWAVVVGGGGGSVAWGDITGTLSAQTDLQTALDLKLDSASYTASDVKIKYESNADTNAFTDAEKTKLAGIATGAEVNTVDTVFGRSGAVVAVAGDYDDTEISSPASATNYTPTASTVRGHLAGIDTALASAGGGVSYDVVANTLVNTDLANFTAINAKGAGVYVSSGVVSYPNFPHGNTRFLISIYEFVAGEYHIIANPIPVSVGGNYQGSEITTWKRTISATYDTGWLNSAFAGTAPTLAAGTTSNGIIFASAAAMVTALQGGRLMPIMTASSNTANVMPSSGDHYGIEIKVLYNENDSAVHSPAAFICYATRLAGTAAQQAVTYKRVYTVDLFGQAPNNGTWTAI